MIKITLSEQERRQLEGMFTTTAEGRLRIRCQAILMAHRHSAEDLGVTVRTLQRWLRAYQDKRLGGLKLQWSPGWRAHIPAALAPEILGWILHGPIGCGLDWAHWTNAELATQLYRTHGITVSTSTMRALQLYRTHGITVSTSTMRAFCTSYGVRPSHPTYHDRKADPVQQAAARQELQALKKGRGGRTGLAESR